MNANAPFILTEKHKQEFATKANSLPLKQSRFLCFSEEKRHVLAFNVIFSFGSIFYGATFSDSSFE